MSNSMEIHPAHRLIPLPAIALVARAASYANTAKAANTKLAYDADFAMFKGWAKANGLPSLPTSAEVLACYVAGLADTGRKASTIARAVAGIRAAHRVANLDAPQGKALDQTMAGIRRQLGTAPAQKTPVMASDLKKMMACCPDTLAGKRDRAILLIGWLGAFRRSELVSLNVEDIVFGRQGLQVTLRRSKTDQNGEGSVKGLPDSLEDDAFSPTVVLKEWLNAANIQKGPIFREIVAGSRTGGRLGDRSVSNIIKALAEKAGLDPKVFSGHSLRAGLATEAAENGRSIKSIMNQTGHKSEKIVLRYVRHATVWSDNAAAGLL